MTFLFRTKEICGMKIIWVVTFAFFAGMSCFAEAGDVYEVRYLRIKTTAEQVADADWWKQKEEDEGLLLHELIKLVEKGCAEVELDRKFEVNEEGERCLLEEETSDVYYIENVNGEESTLKKWEQRVGMFSYITLKYVQLNGVNTPVIENVIETVELSGREESFVLKAGTPVVKKTEWPNWSVLAQRKDETVSVSDTSAGDECIVEICQISVKE